MRLLREIRLLRRHRLRRSLTILLITVLLSAAAHDIQAQEVVEMGHSPTLSEISRRSLGPVAIRGEGLSDPVRNAVEDYRKTGRARTIERSSVVIHPYGHSQPMLRCAPLRACMVELEAGEELMAVIAGDTERWLLSEAYTGGGGNTPLIVVKPTGWNLTTNLIISTDRRIYELTLDAPPAQKEIATSTNPQQFYTRRIKFYYPDDMVRTLGQEDMRGGRPLTEAIPAMNLNFSLENLNFSYEWQGGRGFPFELEQVFDDGAHTYIKLPHQAQHDVAPVLFVVENGERKILNYTVRVAEAGSQYYITDRVLGRAVMVIGTERKNWRGKIRPVEQQMHIVNKNRG